MTTTQDKKEIEGQLKADSDAKDDVSRKAWRGTMLAAVGSLAFFLSTIGNVRKTWSSHGNPFRVVETHDLALYSVPILVIAYFLVETSKNGEDKDAV